MNIGRKNIINLLMVLLGLFILANVFCFIQGIDILFGVLRNYSCFRVSSIVITIIVSGFGIHLGVSLLNKTVNPAFVSASLVYSGLFFILQLIITIVPSASACKCTTISEAILNVQDWSRIESALGLVVFNVIVWGFCRKLKGFDVTPAL